MSDTALLTRHARRRCGERYPGMDPLESLARAVPVGWRRVRRMTAWGDGPAVSRHGTYLADFGSGAVWVVAGGRVVTVLVGSV